MKWIDVEDEMPRPADEILFTDGHKVFFGWLEAYEIGEDPMFYCSHEVDIRSESNWPENITHWMKIPRPPKQK